MKRNDIILLCCILVLGIAAIWFMNISREDGSMVEITIGGKEYKTLKLNVDTVLTIKQNNGDYNTIEVKDNAVEMIASNCPDKICVMHKKIQYKNETIVCLPHKLVIKIINGKDSGVDMIADGRS